MLCSRCKYYNAYANNPSDRCGRPDASGRRILESAGGSAVRTCDKFLTESGKQLLVDHDGQLKR